MLRIRDTLTIDDGVDSRPGAVATSAPTRSAAPGGAPSRRSTAAREPSGWLGEPGQAVRRHHAALTDPVDAAEARHDGETDDVHRRRPVRARKLQPVADVHAELVRGQPAERDLVGTGREAPAEQWRRDVALHVLDADQADRRLAGPHGRAGEDAQPFDVGSASQLRPQLVRRQAQLPADRELVVVAELAWVADEVVDAGGERRGPDRPGDEQDQAEERADHGRAGPLGSRQSEADARRRRRARRPPGDGVGAQAGRARGGAMAVEHQGRADPRHQRDEQHERPEQEHLPGRTASPGRARWHGRSRSGRARSRRRRGRSRPPPRGRLAPQPGRRSRS